MFRYWYLMLALTVGVAGLFALRRIWRRSGGEGSTTLMDYLLVWPLVFRAERQSKARTRLGFVVVGVLVVIALLVADRFVNVRRNG